MGGGGGGGGGERELPRRGTAVGEAAGERGGGSASHLFGPARRPATTLGVGRVTQPPGSEYAAAQGAHETTGTVGS